MSGPRRGYGRDERGAAAVVFAITATMLLTFGAFAVDFGQAYAKKSLLQTDVDLAVMAAAAELDNAGPCNQEVVDKATEFLNKATNAVPGQYVVDLGGSSADNTGYITCHDWQVDLWAPKSHVDYTLAKVVSPDDGLDVQATASAQIRSGRGGATLPFFAVQGCDSGLQSIRNPSGPVTVPVIPPLVPTSVHTNNATFTISPESTPTGSSSVTLTLTGKNLNGIDTVVFTGPGTPSNVEITLPAKITSNDATFTVSVPESVLATEGVWYVRLKKDGEYSATQEAQPFTVGDETLYCDARYEGNFGTIDIPRSEGNSGDYLALNIIEGIEPALGVHPSPNGECDGQAGSVTSKTAPVDGTNCVASETGLKVSATTDGLVTGADGRPGRLDTDSTSNCSRTGSSSRTPGTVKGIHLNDDVLTCFITNGASIADLVAGDADGTNALSADIFDSPRFFWLPVLDTDPSMGKKYWPIIGYVPGFVTDQDMSATRDAPGAISSLNGLTGDPNGIAEVKVVLFSESALPEFAPAHGGEPAYTGSGTKTLVLVK